MEIDGLAGVTSPLLHVFDQLRDDGLVRRDRVLGAGDGAPDDDVARAALDGLGGRRHARLVPELRAGRAHARGDDERIRAEQLAHGLSLHGRADDAVDAVALGEHGKARGLVGHGRIDADLGQRVLAHAREHGNRHEIRAIAADLGGLIGALAAREPVEELRAWSQLDTLPADRWLHLNFEALKTAPPTEVDPRQPGEALWERQHGAALLEAKRRLDPLQFEAMYQGRPSAREGLLYGLNFAEYDCLPHEIVRRANYTDTADTGDDYLCSLSYAVDADGVIYITDAVYSREPMEATEPLVGEMLVRSDTRQAAIESNNGGRGFARAVQALAPGVRVEWFHQSGNKEARILSNSATALHLVRFPRGWNLRWPELYAHLTTYRRKFRANRWHDAADVVTGIVEREAAGRGQKRVRGIRFL